MSIITRKPVQLSLTERTEAASAQADAALSVFKLAAGDLDNAAVELDAVAAEAEERIRMNSQIAAEAENAAYEHRVRATAIRAIYEPLLPATPVFDQESK